MIKIEDYDRFLSKYLDAIKESHVGFLKNFNFINLLLPSKLFEMSKVCRIKEFKMGNTIYT